MLSARARAPIPFHIQLGHGCDFFFIFLSAALYQKIERADIISGRRRALIKIGSYRFSNTHSRAHEPIFRLQQQLLFRSCLMRRARIAFYCVLSRTFPWVYFKPTEKRGRKYI
jgi:hypothetical protein